MCEEERRRVEGARVHIDALSEREAETTRLCETPQGARQCETRRNADTEARQAAEAELEAAEAALAECEATQP